jgi:myosin heavy subunit
VEVDSKDLLSSNAARYDRYEDMAQMGELNEACVLDNLKQRYSSNLIYVMNCFYNDFSLLF